MRDADLKAEVISNSNPNRVAMVSKVVSESVLDSMTEDGKLPYWTGVHKLDSLRSGEDGKIRSTTTSTFTAVIGKKARFNAGKLRHIERAKEIFVSTKLNPTKNLKTNEERPIRSTQSR